MTDIPGLGDLAVADFEPLVGTQFEAALPGRTEQLVLVAVDVYQDHIGGSNRTRIPFSLTFQGTTPGLMMLQRVHPLSHPALGTHEIFLVPLGVDGDGTYSYEAAFA